MSAKSETQTMAQMTAEIETLARDQGKEMVRLQVINWLRAHVDEVPYLAQCDLLRILGVKLI